MSLQVVSRHPSHLLNCLRSHIPPTTLHFFHQMSDVPWNRATASSSEKEKREWIRYFFLRNWSKTDEELSKRLEQFGYTQEALDLMCKVRPLMVSDLPSVRNGAHRRIEQIRHLVSLSEISNLDPAKNLAGNLVGFVLEKISVEFLDLGREAFLSEAKELLLDIGLPGCTNENSIANILSLLSSKVEEVPRESEVDEQPQEDHSLRGTNVVESNEVCLQNSFYGFSKLLKQHTGKDPNLNNSLDRKGVIFRDASGSALEWSPSDNLHVVRRIYGQGWCL